jgi:hypothetical protein
MSKPTLAFLPVLSVVLATAMLDALAYLFLPVSATAFAPAYRNRAASAGHLSQQEIGRGYPRYYFQADNEMGFDIAPGASAIATVDRYSYDVFANDLGCFDRNHLADFQRAEDYAYVTGDSFAWGYTRYESKFGTLWEERTRIATAKCGITHSGQRHQFTKFERVIARIGKMPEVVFVSFFPNDPANDWLYPHTTVLRGFQVDTVYLRDGELFRPVPAEIEKAVENALRSASSTATGPADAVKAFLRTYSLTSHLLDLAVGRVLGSDPILKGAPRSSGEFGASLYEALPLAVVRAHYLTDSRTLKNREAIRAWGEHARRHGYRLVFVLIPPRTIAADTTLFATVKEWLTACAIGYVDLTETFSKDRYRVGDLYWQHDGHLNERGNQVVGHALLEAVQLRP